MQTRKTRKGDTITLTYDTLNRLSTKAAPSEATVTYVYDLTGRLAVASDASAAVAPPAFSASYRDDARNRPPGRSEGAAPGGDLAAGGYGER